MFDSIKKIILWNHERGTWQYDIFCLLIITFIFLTPKTWFEKREKLATQTVSQIVKASDFSLEKIFLKKESRESSENEKQSLKSY